MGYRTRHWQGQCDPMYMAIITSHGMRKGVFHSWWHQWEQNVCKAWHRYGPDPREANMTPQRMFYWCQIVGSTPPNFLSGIATPISTPPSPKLKIHYWQSPPKSSQSGTITIWRMIQRTTRNILMWWSQGLQKSQESSQIRGYSNSDYSSPNKCFIVL